MMLLCNLPAMQLASAGHLNSYACLNPYKLPGPHLPISFSMLYSDAQNLPDDSLRMLLNLHVRAAQYALVQSRYTHSSIASFPTIHQNYRKGIAQ
jgi:hypothetical protein